MKNKIIPLIIISFLLIINIGYCYQQANTSVGKVIYDISRQEALEQFGVPVSIERDVWKYSSPEEFFVYFPPKASVAIFPRQIRLGVNMPLEFKVFALLYNSQVKDVTSDAEIVPEDPEAVTKDRSGNFMTHKAGNYIIFARYGGSLSNPCYLTITSGGSGGGEEDKTEKLLNIDILPFKPQIVVGGGIEFVIAGTFFDPVENKYSVRRIERNVDLFIENAGNIVNVNSKYVKFPSPGKFNVFCRYKGVESYRQECLVTAVEQDLGHNLKQIALLPEFMLVPIGNNIQLKAFGSFYDNHVEDITGKVSWKVDKKDMLRQLAFDEFSTESVGIIQVSAGVGSVKSLPAKVVILPSGTDTNNLPLVAPLEDKKQNAKSEKNDLPDQIKKEADKLSGTFANKARIPNRIMIVPAYLQLAMGETGKFQAMLVYNDDSQEDITLFGEWASSDSKVASVAEGKVNALSEGSVDVRIKFKNNVSAPARVIVGPPRLVSIAVSPQEVFISMKDKAILKAEGHYSDSSHKDITELVEWRNDNPWIARVSRQAEVLPLWFGTTKVKAIYSGVTSLPVRVKVIFTFAWLLGILLKIALLVLSVLTIIFIIFFIIAEAEKKRLRNLFYSDPRKFIIAIYANLSRILAIFGFYNRNHLPPLSFAAVVENAYSIKENSLLKLTVKYEEAKYSNHSISKEDASGIIASYNALLSVLYKRDNKLLFFYRYCIGLTRRLPFGKIKA